MNTKTAIIIEARLTSMRFPNKVLANFKGKPILQHILDELAPLSYPIIVAIPKTKPNDFLAQWLADRKILHFRGHEVDVLNRFFETAIKFKVNTIIRVCADSPLINRWDLRLLIDYYFKQKPQRMIWGMGFWIFSLKELDNANLNIIDAETREHVVRPFTKTVDYIADIERLEND